MVKDDGKQWLLELTQTITSQLKSDRAEISSLWETVRRNGEIHNSCREHVLDRIAHIDKELVQKVADIDSRLKVTVWKVGLLISAIVVLGQYLLNHLLGK